MFQKTIVNKYIACVGETEISQKYEAFRAIFASDEKQVHIRESKEEQYQEGFLRDLFCSVLGYTINPEAGYNLITEKRNESSDKKDARKADGAVIIRGKVKCVIELKGTDTTDLTKIETQGFGYKAHNTGCRYVVISNFEKLRFYVDDATEHLEFNLFALGKDDFALLYTCLALQQITADVPASIKAESISEEKDITDKFYRDYSAFKRELFEDILGKNPDSCDKLLLFRKTQKLLDRLLFVFFCEDRGLLPENCVMKTVDAWRQLRKLDAYVPLYERFKNLFNRLNTGYKSEDGSFDIFAYNGGLFKPDEVLDAIYVSDEVLEKHCAVLAAYNFDSQVSVDILGHIFEHSLTEIEEMQETLTSNGLKSIASNDRAVGKRKKDGVFYTPAYITKYIVSNTIGKLCDEKKNALGINDEAFSAKRKTKAKKEELSETLRVYREWLLGLKICDPACGSGAFLNAALAFLKTEHALVDELSAKIYGDTLVFSEIDNDILERNIYGVDINEESVEIARLSLWLHTAKRGRKLTTLNDNIKCGNSLIDNSQSVIDNSFDWEKEFPEVFANGGGFDVVIGNPPYVRVQQLDYKIIDYLKAKYKTALKRIDISLCFIEKSKDLIKDNGYVSFITSNQFLTTEYGLAMRQFLLNEFFLTDCVDFGDLPIFADAMTYVSIFKFSKQKQENFKYVNISDMDVAQSGQYSNFKIIELDKLNDSNWNLQNNTLEPIFDKLQTNTKLISEIGNAWYGIVSGADNIFIFDKRQYEETEIEKDIFLPLMRAQNCYKYYCSNAEKFIIYPYKTDNNNTILLTESELKQEFPKAFTYLNKHKTELESRKDSRSTFKGRSDWYCLTRFSQLDVFKKEKILTPGEVKEHKFCIDNTNAGYSGARVFGIVIDNTNYDLKYVLCILNSDLMKAYLQSFSSLKAGGYYSYSSNILNRVPIKNIPLEQQLPFIELADKMLSLNADLQRTCKKFLGRVKETFSLEKLPTALEDFYNLTFADFVKELAKQKIKLSLKDKDEWEEYFDEYKASCQTLAAHIVETDKAINARVYELYDLSAEEISVVEKQGA